MTRREAHFSGMLQGLSLPGKLPGFSYRDYSRCLPDYLRSLARAAYEKRNRAIAALTTADAIHKRQKWATETFLKLIGGLPERTPLQCPCHRNSGARRVPSGESGVRKPAPRLRNGQPLRTLHRQTALSGRSVPDGPFAAGQGLPELSEMLPGAGAPWLYRAGFRSHGPGRAHLLSGLHRTHHPARFRR